MSGNHKLTTVRTLGFVRTITTGARTYGSVKSILDNKFDSRPVQKRATDGTAILHANIRGPRYYS